MGLCRPQHESVAAGSLHARALCTCCASSAGSLPGKTWIAPLRPSGSWTLNLRIQTRGSVMARRCPRPSARSVVLAAQHRGDEHKPVLLRFRERSRFHIESLPVPPLSPPWDLRECRLVCLVGSYRLRAGYTHTVLYKSITTGKVSDVHNHAGIPDYGRLIKFRERIKQPMTMARAGSNNGSLLGE